MKIKLELPSSILEAGIPDPWVARIHNICLKSKSISLYFDLYKTLANKKKQIVSPIVFQKLISKDEVEEGVAYFKNQKCFYGHVPKYATESGSYDENTNQPYLSYRTATSLLCPNIHKVMFNRAVLDYVKDAIGESFQIYSVNTFWTMPNAIKHLTHSFHRDEDGFNVLTLFLSWTPTSIGDGHFEYIDGTCDFEFIKKMCKDCGISIDQYYNVNKSCTNGYTQNFFYENIFGSAIKKMHSEPGTATLLDTWGIHRGSEVMKPRLVTWIRYASSKNTSYYFDRNILSGEEMVAVRKEQIYHNYGGHLRFLVP